MSTIRSAQRNVAKARMAALGMDRINRRMSTEGPEPEKQKTWRRVLTGDLAEKADEALRPKLIRKGTRKIKKIQEEKSNG